ncbi:hypothetical protein ACIPYS_17960 [Kitasatospora sp. NPDC089913]|uniref:hypothetical protein n=1 Tax=Kitasatospora sp. NPDC089913 TaxID=3364080 RepID=UPI0037F206B5
MNWEKTIEISRKVASELARKWPVVEADDVHQEIMLHMMEQRSHLEKRADDFTFLRQVAWRAAKSYASREQMQKDLMDEQYFYTPDEVRMTLKSFIYTDEEIGEMIGRKDDLTRCRITDNITSARIDAGAALRKLKPEYKEAVTRTYIYGLPPATAGEAKTAQRGVDALATAMNSHIRSKARAAR